jgi:hypothetical protein
MRCPGIEGAEDAALQEVGMTGETVLIAEDDAAIRTGSPAPSRARATTPGTSIASSLWRWIVAGEGDVVITDVASRREPPRSAGRASSSSAPTSPSSS